jgi:hypothetical protein
MVRRAGWHRRGRRRAGGPHERRGFADACAGRRERDRDSSRDRATDVSRALSDVLAGYRVVAINPMQVARYRERYSTSSAKSDAGDARVLADIGRLEADRHRRIAGDSHLAEAIGLLAALSARSAKASDAAANCPHAANALGDLVREISPSEDSDRARSAVPGSAR